MSSIRLDEALVKKLCDVGEAGQRIIQATGFVSQNEFNINRAMKAARILQDFFEPRHFAGRRILELGPGHYSFALLARHLGAAVVCVERDPSFAALGRHLGFEVLETDYRVLERSQFAQPFDALWVKGTFNACHYADMAEVQSFVDRITGLLSGDAWGWFVTLNKKSKGENVAAFVKRRIGEQKQAFEKRGWIAVPIEEDERRRYGVNYRGGYYYFTRGLPAFEALARRRSAPDLESHL